MACNQKSDPNLFPTGVLGQLNPIRTKFDLGIIAKSNTSSIPDYMGSDFPTTFGLIKEQFCPCPKISSNTGRTLAFDDPYQSASYFIKYGK